MLNKLRNWIKIVLIILVIFMVYKGTGFILSGNGPNGEKVLNCGTIMNKYDNDVLVGKYGRDSRHHYYMDIRFDNNEYRTKDVSTDTYYNHEVNSRVCFLERDENYPAIRQIADFACIIITIAFWFALAVVTLYYFGHAIYWVFTGDWCP